MLVGRSMYCGMFHAPSVLQSKAEVMYTDMEEWLSQQFEAEVER